jgi:hypothetical protein
VLAARIDSPPVDVVKRCTLLEPPRRGLRVEARVSARQDTGPVLWASHPMLAVEPGWLTTAEVMSSEADAVLPGRFADAAVSWPIPVPEPGLGWSEVVYASGVSAARIGSPDGRQVTEIAWDSSFFSQLWVTTVTGEAGIDLCVVPEPATTKPYRMSQAVPLGQARSLASGERADFWVELASADGVPTRPSSRSA